MSIGRQVIELDQFYTILMIKKIIQLIREKGTKKAEISFASDDSPQMIKITNQNKLDSAARVKELLMDGGYQDIKITTQNGKVVCFENTRKIKLG